MTKTGGHHQEKHLFLGSAQCPFNENMTENVHFLTKKVSPVEMAAIVGDTSSRTYVTLSLLSFSVKN